MTRCKVMLMALLVTSMSGAALAREVPRVAEDRGFLVFPFLDNGEPIDPERLQQLQTRTAANIVLVDFSDRQQLVVQSQGPFQQQDQQGLNLDVDHDGQGDLWILVSPGQRQSAQVLDAHFVLLGEVEVELGETRVVYPLGEIAERYGFEDAFGDFDPAVIVASFNLELGRADVVPFGPRERPIGEVAPYYIGQLLEMVQVNAPQQDSPAYGFLIESQQQYQQQQMLKDKYCPPKKASKTWYVDAQGDGLRNDYYFRNNTQVHGWGRSYLRIELYCLNDSAFGKRVVEGGGRRGWIGKCPYAGGRNYQVKKDLDGDGVPDYIRRQIIDGGGDDDGDGDLDITVYHYDVNSGRHRVEQWERDDFYSGAGNAATMDAPPIQRYGPYPNFSGLPGPYSFTDPD